MALPDGDVTLARKLLKEGAVLLDVRTPDEYRSGHLAGAVNVPHDQVDYYLTEIAHLTGGEKQWAIIVYCVFGKRGAIAKQRLTQLGYENVLNIGGLDGLLGRPLVEG